jgi:membrane protein DedA with SNARE-associated domain
MSQWIQENVIRLIESMGYLGIGLLMFLENLFPPIPSELIMPFAGFTAAKPDSGISFLGAVTAGVLGTIFGAYPWYYLGKVFNEERLEKMADKYGKWISVSAKDIRKVNNWFIQHGVKAVLLGRLIPGIRTLISLPAGINNMNIFVFSLYTTIGTVVWVLLLTTAGYKLGENYKVVEKYIDPVSKIVLVSLIIWFVLWIVRKQMRKNA